MKRHLCTLLLVLAGHCLPTTDSQGASCNSVVRFQIRYGVTLFGDIDVELFDFDKPVTVSNFLYHVRSGGYDRSFLHRLVPNFILQGGLYTVENPASAALFQTMSWIPQGRPITNEFNTGPRIGNTFGTLAMALYTTNIDGNYYPVLDSATTSWYFNTQDNSQSLDPTYTVFGRVVAGSEHLTFFNTFTEDSGIINMSGLSYLLSACPYPEIIGGSELPFDSLPVAYFIFDCPGYSDLFNVRITVLKSAGAGGEVCLSGPLVSGGQFLWSFFAERGHTYDVQFVSDLNRTNWNVLRTITGDGRAASFTVSPTNRAQFHRVARR